jgi:hypothetical protein
MKLRFTASKKMYEAWGFAQAVGIAYVTLMTQQTEHGDLASIQDLQSLLLKEFNKHSEEHKYSKKGKK